MPHIDRNIVAALNILGGNFEVTDESKLSQLKKAGKAYTIIQHPSSPEYFVEQLVGSSVKFDLALNNTVDYALGLSAPNFMTRVNLGDSYYCRMRKREHAEMEHRLAMKQGHDETEKLRRQLEIDTQKKRMSDLRSQSLIAQSGLVDAERIEGQVVKAVAEITEAIALVKDHLKLTSNAKVSEIKAKLSSIKEKSSEFERLMDSLPT